MGGRDSNRRSYQHVLDLVARQYGLTLEIARRPHLSNVLDQAARVSRCASIEQYVDLLSSPGRGTPMAALVRLLVVGETHFFRNAPQFRALEREILPALIAAARERASTGGRPRLRIWSAGCATGEEPYSIAMLLIEAGVSPHSWALEVIGTDVQEEWLQAATRGHYSCRSVERGTSPERRARFFARRDGGYQLNEVVRSLVTFCAGNVLNDAPPFQDCDLVLCRNVTIYFREREAAAVFERLAGALRPGGVLLTGHAETLERDALGVVSTGDAAAFAYRRLTSADRAAPRGGRSAAKRDGHRTRTSPAPSTPPQRAAHAPPVESPRAPAPPLDPGERLRRGIQYTQAGDVNRAIEELRRCVFLAPDLVGARFLLATVLQRAGQHVDARREYRAVARSLRGRDPSDLVPGADGFDAKTLLNAALRGLSSR